MWLKDDQCEGVVHSAWDNELCGEPNGECAIEGWELLGQIEYMEQKGIRQYKDFVSSKKKTIEESRGVVDGREKA